MWLINAIKKRKVAYISVTKVWERSDCMRKCQDIELEADRKDDEEKTSRGIWRLTQQHRQARLSTETSERSSWTRRFWGTKLHEEENLNTYRWQLMPSHLHNYKIPYGIGTRNSASDWDCVPVVTLIALLENTCLRMGSDELVVIWFSNTWPDSAWRWRRFNNRLCTYIKV